MISTDEIRTQGEAALGKYLKPSAEDMITALRVCAEDVYPCEGCYIYPYSRDWRVPTGQTCFERLALDVIKAFEDKEAEIEKLKNSLSNETKRANDSEAARDEWEQFAAGEQQDGITMMNERDHWKARAEALERAIKDECKYCIHGHGRTESDGCYYCGCPKRHWQFDELRFASNDGAW